MTLIILIYLYHGKEFVFMSKDKIEVALEKGADTCWEYYNELDYDLIDVCANPKIEKRKL